MRVMMKWLFDLPLVLLIGLAPLAARAGGDEVVVVYNSNMPESKAVADHYAAMRHVPASQVFGFDLPDEDTMSRDDFTELLQKPLADKLVAAKLWRFGTLNFPAKNGAPAHNDERVVYSRIRYAALCYGVPVKIDASSLIDEVEQKLMQKELQHNEAAVDSELTWLPLVRMKVPLTGPLPNPFYTCTNSQALNCTNGILLVSRLDGPTPAIARGLVDKAMEAESNGLWGRAYFDARGLPPKDAFYEGDVWMKQGAEICRLAGMDVEIDTNEATLPATYPMSHIAVYAGWYSAGICGPFLAPKMEFMPGAFAYHLFSFSASNLRGDTNSWCNALLSKGATCTMGCVYEPYLVLTPNVAFFLLAFENHYTFAEAAWASQRALSWQITVIGDPLYQPSQKPLPDLHAQLAREKSPLLEWSFERLVNLDLVHGVRAQQCANFLESIPITGHSAVLTEKLAELNDTLGKPASAIAAWQKALTLNPSPQQRIRLHRLLGEKLLSAGRDQEAEENWRQFIADSPDYPGIDSIRLALRDLNRKLAKESK